MGRWIFYAMLSLIAVSGLVVVIYYGIQPRSVPKIKFSQFSAAEDIGRATAQRLRLEIQGAPFLIVGVWPDTEEQVRVVDGLLKALNEPGLAYEVIVAEPGLGLVERFAVNERVSLRDETTRFAEGAKQILASGKRLVALVPSSYSSQLIPDGQANRLKKEFGMDPTSITLMPFPVRREDEKKRSVRCDTNIKDETGIGPLACAALFKARTMYRGKKDLSKYSASLDLVGGRDYLLLVAPPQGD
ncbi:MAG: hypothetical protein KF802_10955 [Bdellovibrionaceae bacterium]|nr:hypothetical protein [Pseudobdellovibrionaceae bacterium]MBX3032633.1 hypothetical protein [Pseudobdellovibrionaceae bacterium]